MRPRLFLAILTILVASLLVPTAAEASIPDGNLVPNPSFETDLSGWTAISGSLGRVATASAPDGAYVASVTRKSGPEFGLQAANVVPSGTAGSVYQATAWLAAGSSSSVGKTAVVVVRELDASGSLVASQDSPSIGLTTSFQQVQVSLRIARTGDRLDVRVLQRQVSGGNAFRADLVTLVMTTQGGGGGGGGPCGTSANPPSAYDHVIWLFMENHNWSDIFGDSSAPYENSLAAQCGTDTQWADAGSAYQSLPNYIAATTGISDPTALQPFAGDDAPSSSVSTTADNIFRQARAAGGTERSYEEGMSANCSTSGTRYAARHNPAEYMWGGSDPQACLADDIPMGSVTSGNLINDLNNNTLPTFSFITPDLCNDMHDCSVATGDAFLGQLVPQILASPAYQAGRTALFITWDEDTPVPNIVVAPSVVPGTVATTPVNHYGMLRATEEMLGLPLLGAASTATSLSGVFNLLGSSTPPPAPTITDFSPTSGAVGTSVTINGSGFTGTSAVAFNGTSASFTINSDSKITATVPSQASTGPISVVAPGGTVASPTSFTVTTASSLSFRPDADTYVQQDRPSNNHGSATTMSTDYSPIKNILLKFTVSGVGTNSVKGAKLRLYCVDASAKGGDFYRVADNSWQENTVTWNTAPVADPTGLASLGAVTSGTWYEVDLTSLVTGDGTYSLRVTTTSKDGADYSTKEGSAGFAPQLLVTLN
jgi:hypothetical protein